MGKAVKFSLTINNIPIRTMDELRDNFEIAEVVELYKNQKLQNWLLNRGYTQELDKLNELQSPSSRSLVTALMDIFNIDLGNVDIDQVVDHVAYKENLSSSQGEQVEKQQAISVVNNYYQQYLSLLDDIQQHSLSLPALKVDIQNLLDNYYDFLSLDFIVFINMIYNKAPLAMLALMGHKRWWELCDLFDNHNSRWCKNLFTLNQAPAQQDTSFTLPSEKEEQPVEEEKGWFAGLRSKFTKSSHPQVAEDSMSPTIAVNAGKQMVLGLIMACRPAWAEHIQKKDINNLNNWERVVDKNKICLVINYDEKVDLRAAEEISKSNGVFACAPFTRSLGLECKSSSPTRIYYVVL